MIKSMTGYGRRECELPEKKLTIEIRSLNSKQMDTSTRLPAIYKEKELEIRQMLASGLERGKIECTIFYELGVNGSTTVINVPVVKNYYEQLSRIAGDLGLKTSEEIFSAIMRFPDTLQSEKPDLREQEWEIVKNGISEAIKEVDSFRIQEGRAIERDIKDRINAILEKLNSVSQFEKDRIDRIRERIGNSLTEFLGSDIVDQNRLEQEIIYYIEKIDITEEKVRLKNHCKYFMETLGSSESSGKKLGFISQEMGREINTLGSKANHSDIQKLVVEMKDELEKVKEQVLNIL